ncbi:hypothetical protein [uncultured Prevotella sp.]|uniref:hypothetical protein n=1 Tax=uncultured Prevotella sp. TaxID=159272 RepID=UPI00265C8DF7|nr:hypothetical protein [uncultured Prevotella sp.]
MCKRIASMRLNMYSAVAAVARGEELSAGGGCVAATGGSSGMPCAAVMCIIGTA